MRERRLLLHHGRLLNMRGGVLGIVELRIGLCGGVVVVREGRALRVRHVCNKRPQPPRSEVHGSGRRIGAIGMARARRGKDGFREQNPWRDERKRPRQVTGESRSSEKGGLPPKLKAL